MAAMITRIKDTGLRQAGYYKDSHSKEMWEASEPITLDEFNRLLDDKYDHWMFPYYCKGTAQVDATHFTAAIGRYYLD